MGLQPGDLSLPQKVKICSGQWLHCLPFLSSGIGNPSIMYVLFADNNQVVLISYGSSSREHKPGSTVEGLY